MKKHFARVLTSTLAACLVGASFVMPANAATDDPPVTPKIVGGQYPSQPDGAVSLWAPSYNGFSCSASRIGSYWVLTARHCAELGPTYVYTNSIYKVTGDYAKIKKIYYASSGDVALLQLETAPPGKVLPYSNKLPAKNSTMEMRGWGMDSASGTSTSKLKSATGTYVGTGTNPYYSGQDLLINGKTGSPWKGDSGGPVTQNGVLYGALSWSTSYGTSTTAQSGYGSIVAHANWIQQTTGIAPNTGGGNPQPTATATPKPTSTPQPDAPLKIEVNSNNWQTVIDASYVRPVAVEFGATWCGACQTLKPIVEKLHNASGGTWTLAYVDVDKNPTITRNWSVTAYPTTFFLWRGKEIPSTRFVGAYAESSVKSYINYALDYAKKNPGPTPTATPTATVKPTATATATPKPTATATQTIPGPRPTATKTTIPGPKPTGVAGGSVLTLTDKNYDEFIAQSQGKTVFLVFSKDGCEPCELLHPVLDEQAAKHGDKTVIGIMDGTLYPDIWAKYQNPWFPTVIAIRDGKELGRYTGYAGENAAIIKWMTNAIERGHAPSDPLVFEGHIYNWTTVEEMSWRHPVIIAYHRSDGACPVCDDNIAMLKSMVAEDGGKWTLVTVDLNDSRTYNVWTYFGVEWSDTIDTYYRDDLVQPRLESIQTEESLRAHITETLNTHYPPKERPAS